MRKCESVVTVDDARPDEPLMNEIFETYIKINTNFVY